MARPDARDSGRTLVIWNPHAGGGAAQDLERRRRQLTSALSRHGIDADLFESPSAEAAERRVDEALAAGARTIVVAGGDGTIRSVALRLLGSEVALAILPAGTAMNLARSLGIPLDIDAAASVVATGQRRRIDVADVGGLPFLEIASIGLGAEILAGAARVGRGRVQGAFDLLGRAIRTRRTRVRLTLDGRDVPTRAVSVAVANGRFTGRGIELAPDASLHDHQLDVLVYEGFGPLGLAADLARLLLGRTLSDRVRRYRASTVEVSSHRPLPIRADSIDAGITPGMFTTRAGALLVVGPAPPG